MEQLSEYLSSKVKVNELDSAPFQHWKQAWWKFHHNQWKFNHAIQCWHNGEVTFNIKIWKDEKLVVAYKYCMNYRYFDEMAKIEQEAIRRGWDIKTIDFNSKTWK